MLPRRRLIVLLAVAVGAAGLLGAVVALGAMKSTKLDTKLCKTRGGGRFVKIPGFPGEKIDRRLLTDIEYLLDRFKHKLFITDGYSTSKVHSRKGEHPIGLALDIVPDFSQTKRWRKVTRLAKWAEPKQDRPRPPFRWVGYNGDAGHGRGHHLHLSWSHSPTKPKDPARTVYTIKCPERSDVEVPEDDTVDDGTDGGAIEDGTLEDGTANGGIESRIREMQRTAVPERR
jgi:hypothetical protein